MRFELDSGIHAHWLASVLASVLDNSTQTTMTLSSQSESIYCSRCYVHMVVLKTSSASLWPSTVLYCLRTAIRERLLQVRHTQ